MRIVKNDDTVEELTQGLEGKESYVSTLASILEDVGWIEQEPSGKYMITDKGNSEAQKYWYDKSYCNALNEQKLHIIAPSIALTW